MIGLLGGTFNPIHFGHINLALELKERCKLKQVWLIPAFLSPLRTEEQSVEPEKRFKMAQLAVADLPDFRVLDIEINRPGPSYTIDTIKELLPRGDKFAWLMGSDVLQEFSQWKDYAEIVRLLPLFIASRLGMPESSLAPFSADVKQYLQKGLVEIPQMDISATTVRERIKKGLYCGHLVPPKVLDYIYENQLYFNP